MAFFWISFSFLACWAACLASSSSFSFSKRAASSSACRACRIHQKERMRLYTLLILYPSVSRSVTKGDRMMTFMNDTHSLLLLLLSLLGISFSFLLRLLPGFFLLFEFLNSRVTAVGRICKNEAIKISSAEVYRTHHRVTDWFSSIPFVLLCVLRLYQLVFVFCSSPLSSSELSKLDSASQSISSHLDCKGEKNMSQSNIWATQELTCVAG